jgi:ribosomal protein S27AE
MARNQKPVIKQIRYERKMRKNNLCPRCGEPTGGKYYCAFHRQKDAARKKAAANGK